jgi:hypothetical protein
MITVCNRETKSPELLQRANQEITRHFSRASSFRAQSLLIVTWDDVGRFNTQTNEVVNVNLISKLFSCENLLSRKTVFK